MFSLYWGAKKFVQPGVTICSLQTSGQNYWGMKFWKLKGSRLRPGAPLLERARAGCRRVSTKLCGTKFLENCCKVSPPEIGTLVHKTFTERFYPCLVKLKKHLSMKNMKIFVDKCPNCRQIYGVYVYNRFFLKYENACTEPLSTWINEACYSW